MSSNPVIATLGRRLRLAVIGGGPGSFIGGMHRMAARIDDCYELVAGVLSSDPERAIAWAKEIGLQKERGYASVVRMLDAEKQKEDGAEVVAFRIAGKEADPLALHFPTSGDGLAGALFVDAVIRSSNNGSSWEKVF